MKQITAVIIDDEPDSISLLQMQLEKHCPQIKVLATFTEGIDEMNFFSKVNYIG